MAATPCATRSLESPWGLARAGFCASRLGPPGIFTCDGGEFEREDRGRLLQWQHHAT